MTNLALAVSVACAASGFCAAIPADQPAYFTWQISGVATTDNGGTSTDNYKAYLFVNSTPSAAYDKTTGVTIERVLRVISGADTETTLQSLAFNNANESGSPAYRVTSGAVSWARTQYGLQSFSDFSFFAVLLDGATLSDAKNYMIAKVNTEENGNTYGKKGSYYMTASTDTTKATISYGWGSQSGNSWTEIGTIPEPTSGVLLIVGVVVLALKRKRMA